MKLYNGVFTKVKFKYITTLVGDITTFCYGDITQIFYKNGGIKEYYKENLYEIEWSCNIYGWKLLEYILIVAKLWTIGSYTIEDIQGFLYYKE